MVRCTVFILLNTVLSGTLHSVQCSRLVRFDGVHPAPCGQCLPCRVNRQRKWGTRIGLELQAHPYSSFLTLTYSREHLPAQPVRKHLSRFMRYLRRRIGAVRFFGVAELGEKRGRPHYHVILFGVPATFEMEDACRKAWKKGFVQLKEVRDTGAADYVCKYILKSQLSEQLLPDGKSASFALMSRRPGIGRQTLTSLSREIASQNILPVSSLGLEYRAPTDTEISRNWDEHTKITYGACLRLDGLQRPLDRYSRSRLFPEKEGPRVKRLRTLMNSHVRWSGGSFSDVEAEARRILEGRLAASRALARARRTVL